MILRDNRESSIEALQLASVYVMISISDSNRFNQTKQRTIMTTRSNSISRRLLELIQYANQSIDPNWQALYKELQKLDSYDPSYFTCRL